MKSLSNREAARSPAVQAELNTKSALGGGFIEGWKIFLADSASRSGLWGDYSQRLARFVDNNFVGRQFAGSFAGGALVAFDAITHPDTRGTFFKFDYRHDFRE